MNLRGIIDGWKAEGRISADDHRTAVSLLADAQGARDGTRLPDQYDNGFEAGKKWERERQVKITLDRDFLGQMVRHAWVEWAKTQDAPKPSWLMPYEELAEPDKEADRQIGEYLVEWMKKYTPAAITSQPVAWRYQHRTGWGDVWRVSDVDPATPGYFETPEFWIVQPLYHASVTEGGPMMAIPVDSACYEQMTTGAREAVRIAERYEPKNLIRQRELAREIIAAINLCEAELAGEIVERIKRGSQ